MFIVTYDITSDKLRTKVANKLIYFGLTRIQYSVFLGTINNSLLPHLKKCLKELAVDLGKGNSILIFPITNTSIKKKIVYGDATYDWQDLMGLRHTLYLD